MLVQFLTSSNLLSKIWRLIQSRINIRQPKVYCFFGASFCWSPGFHLGIMVVFAMVADWCRDYHDNSMSLDMGRVKTPYEYTWPSPQPLLFMRLIIKPLIKTNAVPSTPKFQNGIVPLLCRNVDLLTYRVRLPLILFLTSLGKAQFSVSYLMCGALDNDP